jgi:hypothetical protein
MSGISVATLREPEFINITSISPLISKCEIKVLYVGENRNKSYITKEVAAAMAQTLPGTPIVGHFIESKEDYGDHGDQVVIDSEGVKFNKLTKPYGFVAPDAKVWFQEFQDTDEFGNVTIREYLMTEGYLWTEQYEECKRILNDGNPQSMELYKKTLKGHWSTDTNTGIEFFIINDAMFLNLCVLGEDVEPCFEGANITSPNISASFSKDSKTIVKTLSDMMLELKFALQGGQQEMDGNTVIPSVVEEEAVLENPTVEENLENSSTEQDKIDETPVVENQDNTEEFAKKDDEEDKEDESNKDESNDNSSEDKKEDEEDKEKKYSLEEYNALQSQLDELQEKYSLLEVECNSLREFKNNIEDSKKDELIASFCMLSDEDKQDVIENKSKYSLDDIEAKLSVICYRKKVNFDLSNGETENNNEEVAPITYNLNETEANAIPAWIKAVQAIKERNK